jgi:hypothetical protein
LVITLFLPSGDVVHGATAPTTAADIRLCVSIAVSFVILAAGLFIILSKRYQADDKNWAFAAVGTVVGFWLPTATAAAT